MTKSKDDVHDWAEEDAAQAIPGAADTDRDREVETLPGQWVCPTCGGTFIADQIERHQEWHEWI